ncbi:MAG: hypothetical protein Greene041679_214 [Parcubacteria group bacterium Greene0416_79]|nr:MAG: hypothetical protein Greene041679_214 [Parcubacteria group bacterium Greene0416_79]
MAANLPRLKRGTWQVDLKNEHFANHRYVEYTALFSKMEAYASAPSPGPSPSVRSQEEVLAASCRLDT